MDYCNVCDTKFEEAKKKKSARASHLISRHTSHNVEEAKRERNKMEREI